MATKPAAKSTTKSKPATATTPVTVKPAAAKPVTAAAAKPAVKPVAKPAAKPVTKAAAKPAAAAPKKTVSSPAAKTTGKPVAARNKPAPASKSVATDKPKAPKIKMERDSFTMPKDEYAQIAALKKRLEGLGKPVKKSELLRAGLKLLSTLNDTALKTAVNTVPVIKTGRPKK